MTGRPSYSAIVSPSCAWWAAWWRSLHAVCRSPTGWPLMVMPSHRPFMRAVWWMLRALEASGLSSVFSRIDWRRSSTRGWSCWPMSLRVSAFCCAHETRRSFSWLISFSNVMRRWMSGSPVASALILARVTTSASRSAASRAGLFELMSWLMNLCLRSTVW